MKVLVTGSGGMLASDLVPCLLEQGYEVVPLLHNKLDITDLEAVKITASTFEPDLIMNCAAYTKVDQAEKEESAALRANGLGVQNLCLTCQEQDIPLVHFSTDYVFDGTKKGSYIIHDEPNPVNAYGRSKLLGEKHVLWLLDKFYLIRSSWLFGIHGPNFVNTMLELGQRQKSVAVVNDQTGCPTWTHHLSQAVVELIETGRYGIYHITNYGPTTWFDFAREIFQLSNLNIKVTPITSNELSQAARRPLNSVLDPFPLPEILGREMPSWKQALRQYLQRRNLLETAVK
jgi:dTDP-4-dehydrorhamnose reductase